MRAKYWFYSFYFNFENKERYYKLLENKINLETIKFLHKKNKIIMNPNYRSQKEEGNIINFINIRILMFPKKNNYLSIIVFLCNNYYSFIVNCMIFIDFIILEHSEDFALKLIKENIINLHVVHMIIQTKNKKIINYLKNNLDSLDINSNLDKKYNFLYDNQNKIYLISIIKRILSNEI